MFVRLLYYRPLGLVCFNSNEIIFREKNESERIGKAKMVLCNWCKPPFKHMSVQPVKMPQQPHTAKPCMI